MTGTTQIVTILMIATILTTGSIVPYSFADDDEDELYECETPSIFKVLYSGPDNAQVEIYKQPKHAKNSQNMLYSFTETFNDGDYIELNSETHMGREHLKAKTTYKIIHGGNNVIIPIDTSCKRPMAVGDIHEKKGITLTVDYGGDLDGIPVIFDKYHVETPNEQQVCAPENLIDFTSPSPNGLIVSEDSLHEDIVAYLADYGIEYSVESSKDIAGIYDSRPPIGADPDLEDPRPVLEEIKNLLIIQENSQPSPPDDDANGGKHIMEFSSPVNLESFRVIDIEGDEDDSFVKGYPISGSPVQQSFPVSGNRNQLLVDDELVGFENLNKIEFDLENSGAITNICITSAEPPVPGTITIIKDTIPDSDDVFSFVTDIPLPDGQDGFTLVDDGTSTQSSITFDNLAAGIYSVEELDSGTHTLDTILCDGNLVENIENPKEVTIELAEGQDVVCTFTNSFIVPPTALITIYNATTIDNQLSHPSEDDYNLIIDGDDTVLLGVEKEVNANEDVIISIDVPTDFTRVVIVGEGCPDVQEFNPDNSAVVNLVEDQHLKCTIYYDDNGNILDNEPGTIFRHDSMQVNMSNNQFGDSCDAIPTVEEKNVTPCIEIVNTAQQRLLVVDSALVSDTTIVLFSITEDGKIDATPEEAAPVPICNIEVIVRHNLPENFFLKDDDDTFPTDPSENLGFLLNCGNLDASKVYNVNYAMIDPI